jgi:flagellar biosynthesis/type III secretory pathway ATPase
MKKLTPQQQEVARKLKPLVEQILNEVGDQNTINYVKKELSLINLQDQYAPIVVFKNGSDGTATKHIRISTDSIPVIINWLKQSYKERQKVENKSTNI